MPKRKEDDEVEKKNKKEKTRGLILRLVEITSEEAGFASGREGIPVVKRDDVAFQV
jgi:hypothetical protein